MIETMYGIDYQLPEVTLLQQTGIGTAEIAARTCYDSFDNSEHDFIKDFDPKSMLNNNDLVNNIEHSELLDTLAWTHFHHSILEHANLTYLIKGTSRGVLQEHARHRIQGISVRSTRYTMSSVINAFMASQATNEGLESYGFFVDKMIEFDLFVTTNEEYNEIEVGTIWYKLNLQLSNVGMEHFKEMCIAKSSIPAFKQAQTPEEAFEVLESGKKKRNVGDAFKHIVTDNWKVDMVVTFNLRSLKNYFDLRDSGAAYFQIQWLAKAMKAVTPSKYLDLIVKK